MKLRFKALSSLVFVAMLCVALLTSCGSQKLSEDFNEDEVRSAAENVIALINNQDSEGLKEICTVQMKQALTDDVLEQIFEAIAEGGEFQEVTEMSLGGTKDKASEEEFAVVIAKAKYEIKTFTYTISFTKQMKLAGLYYR